MIDGLADQSSADVSATSVVERYLANPSDRELFARACAEVKSLLADGHFDEAARLIRALAVPTLDYTSIGSLYRLYKKCVAKCKPLTQTARLAMLSSFTSTQLCQMVELFLFAAGVGLELYEADFGVFRQEIIDPDSGLYQFKPNSVFIAITWRDLAERPPIDAKSEAVDDRVADEVGRWSGLWRTAHDRLGCQIIQNNFDRPSWRQLANNEMRHGASFEQYVSHVNQALYVGAPPYVTIHDIDHLSACAGRRLWNDERFFHHAKLPCAPECMVEYAHSAASVLLSQMGLSKKCLVLDLDNTLWGGVIGDDGLKGIRIGQGDAEGEAFLAFQQYALRLRQRGVILAVCSKNTDSIAREAFTNHPEMALSLNDISCFVANWNDKASNIRDIAAQLNIGINSLVFVDDNPAERSIVRKLVPEVAVPEVSTDPLDFIEALERHRYFQMTSLGKEDLQRTDYYRANSERQQIQTSAQNMEEFLQSLDMSAIVGPINDISLERSTQLINKSNQFNLTTIRRSTAEVLVISQDPTWMTRTVSLKDRFGDNGLICVLLAQIEGDALNIDTWLMSCRVLKRNVEKLLLNDLCAFAAGRHLRIIRGKYIPTAKNALVKDHYSALGFKTISTSGDGQAVYELEVKSFKPFETFIQIESGK